MDSISATLSVLPEERGLIFRTAFGTVPGVRKGTVEGTTGVRTKTCVKGCSNLDDSFPFSFFLFMERIRCLLVSFTLEKKMNRHYFLSTNIESWINFHERPYFTFILYLETNIFLRKHKILKNIRLLYYTLKKIYFFSNTK